MVVKPAFAEQFEPERLRPIAPLNLDGPITREWAWGGATGAGVKVGIIDSGVDADHPFVQGVAGGVVLEHDPEIEGEVRYIEGPHGDLFGHGTACAGIIKKVAPECEIYSIRVLGQLLTGKSIVFAAGIRWAIENGMHVVNMSLSTGQKDYFGMFHELADLAYFRNVALVCAINNTPPKFGPSYPSQYSSVFSVAAHDAKDPFGFDYNPNPPVEFGAPGINIEVAWADMGTTDGIGNSFAAPHITGLVARILSKHPGLTPFQIKTILHSIADNREQS